MIRHARPGEHLKVLPLCQMFAEEAGIDLHPEWASIGLNNYISERNKDVFVLDMDGGLRGFMAVEISSSVILPVTLAQERAFYIAPEYRGKWLRPFLKAFENWAAARKASRVGISALDPRVARVFERLGYKSVETHLSKEI